MSQYQPGQALAANCSIKGADVVCKKCGRSLPDTCGDKHPRVEAVDTSTSEVLPAEPPVVATKGKAK